MLACVDQGEGRGSQAQGTRGGAGGGCSPARDQEQVGAAHAIIAILQHGQCLSLCRCTAPYRDGAQSTLGICMVLIPSLSAAHTHSIQQCSPLAVSLQGNCSSSSLLCGASSWAQPGSHSSCQARCSHITHTHVCAVCVSVSAPFMHTAIVRSYNIHTTINICNDLHHVHKGHVPTCSLPAPVLTLFTNTAPTLHGAYC